MKKLILTVLFILLSSQAFADKLMAEQYQQRPNPHYDANYRPAPQSGSLNELPNQLVDMFMGQGIVGAMLIVLGFWFYRTETQARQDRIKFTDKFEQLVRDSLDRTDLIEVKSGISALDARMQNVERELETLKDFVLSGRIGARNG